MKHKKKNIDIRKEVTYDRHFIFYTDTDHESYKYIDIKRKKNGMNKKQIEQPNEMYFLFCIYILQFPKYSKINVSFYDI